MRSTALVSGVADFGQAKGAVLRILDNIVCESIGTDLAVRCSYDIGFQSLETAACS